MTFNLSKAGEEISIILERGCLHGALHVGVSVLSLPAINSETVYSAKLLRQSCRENHCDQTLLLSRDYRSTRQLSNERQKAKICYRRSAKPGPRH